MVAKGLTPGMLAFNMHALWRTPLTKGSWNHGSVNTDETIMNFRTLTTENLTQVIGGATSAGTVGAHHGTTEGMNRNLFLFV